MKFYSLCYDVDSYDAMDEKGTPYMFARKSNISKIEYPNIKSGCFNTIDIRPNSISYWPNVEYYYDSLESDIETDYLLNVHSWLIVHKRVKNALIENGIKGVTYYPIKLIDIATGKENFDYFLGYINNFIKAYDMEKSVYNYNEKYDCYSFHPRKTYLDYYICSKYDIFRCSLSRSRVYVSERFYDIIKANKFTGFHFTPQP